MIAHRHVDARASLVILLPLGGWADGGYCWRRCSARLSATCCPLPLLSRLSCRSSALCLDGQCESDASPAACGLESDSDGRRSRRCGNGSWRGQSGRQCGARSNTTPPAVCCRKALALLPFPTKFSWHDQRSFVPRRRSLSAGLGPTKVGISIPWSPRPGCATTSIFIVDVRGPCVAVTALAALWKSGAAQETPVGMGFPVVAEQVLIGSKWFTTPILRLSF